MISMLQMAPHCKHSVSVMEDVTLMNDGMALRQADLNIAGTENIQANGNYSSTFLTGVL